MRIIKIENRNEYINTELWIEINKSGGEVKNRGVVNKMERELRERIG